MCARKCVFGACVTCVCCLQVYVEHMSKCVQVSCVRGVCVCVGVHTCLHGSLSLVPA